MLIEAIIKQKLLRQELHEVWDKLHRVIIEIEGADKEAQVFKALASHFGISDIAARKRFLYYEKGSKVSTDKKSKKAATTKKQAKAENKVQYRKGIY